MGLNWLHVPGIRKLPQTVAKMTNARKNQCLRIV